MRRRHDRIDPFLESFLESLIESPAALGGEPGQRRCDKADPVSDHEGGRNPDRVTERWVGVQNSTPVVEAHREVRLRLDYRTEE